jgi:hypothetical protein
MKNAIFLVDDIVDGKIITLLEKVYEKLISKLAIEGHTFEWISETSIVLNNCSSNFITFRKASEFIDEVKNKKIVNNNVDIFYFVSAWLHIKSFHLTNFLAIDPDTTDFLTKHNIPIIIDGSMEMCNSYSASYELFETHYQDYLIDKNHFFRGIKNLKFYVVGGEIVDDYTKTLTRKIPVQHSMFPTAFFRKAHVNSIIYLKSIKQKNTLFNTVRNKVITVDTPIWQAFCRTPRLTRILFQLWADKEKITEYGQYSRLLPGKDNFIQECERSGIFSKYEEKLKFITNNKLNKLDNLKYIEPIAKTPNYQDINGVPWEGTSMFHIVLETCSISNGEEFNCTPSMLTEKTSMAILSGMPFITLGGHKIKNILKSLGFKEYPGLELPSNNESNYFDELEYVIAKVKAIAALTLDKKQELYNSWKEIIMYNYERYLTLDTKKLYLEFLNQPR